MAKDLFYSTRIAGRRFDAVMTAEGPFVVMHNSRIDVQSLPLGPTALITECEENGAPGLWICKYDSRQPRIDLRRFTAEDIQEIVASFGIRLDHPKFADGFYRSKAWKGLREFVARHPRRAKALAATAGYLKNWLSLATEENAATEAFVPRP